MLPHDREVYRQQMGHLWLGFPQDQTRAILSEAGFDAIRVVPLPPDSRVKGPGLFAATAVKRP
jgi:ArsR family transcriptional regulator